MAFRALLNAKPQPFPSLCSSFLCAYCSKKLPKRAPAKKQLRVLSIVGQLCAWAHRMIRLRSIKSSLPFSLPLRHSRDKLFQALSSLVPRHPIFRARPAALSKNRVWTRSLVKLGLNHTSVVACCRTNQIAQVK